MDEVERTVQVGLASQGDQDALQRLIVEYHDVLRAVVARAMDERLRGRLEPDDVLQDAYVAACKALSKVYFNSPAAFYKWLETIALHELKNCYRALRAQKRDVAREVGASPKALTSYWDILDRVTGTDSTPSRRVARGEATAAVLSSLARLSDDQRDVIRLRFLEGKHVSEVAIHLGKTEAAVNGLCRRGLRALRASLTSISRFLSSS